MSNGSFGSEQFLQKARPSSASFVQPHSHRQYIGSRPEEDESGEEPLELLDLPMLLSRDEESASASGREPADAGKRLPRAQASVHQRGSS